MAQISKWKHLGYDIITMAGELDRVQKNKHGSYRHLVMNTDYDLLMLRDRHLPTEQCLADVIDSAMWPYK